MALTTGTKLGPYEVLDTVGTGGMGEVYRARDARLGRDVAIKIIPASFHSDGMRLQRFEQEARAAASLNHPNILAVYDVGRQDGSPYIVSELLAGETLREQLRAGPLPLRRAIEYAQQIARGLAAAHSKGIVHRDLKPENIFITSDRRVKILDFGLAKLTGPERLPDDSTVLGTVGSEPGTVLGTVGYMSPEQVRGKPVDARSDLFAFGAILYEMLSGKRAFHGESAAETMSAILNQEPPELTQSNPNVSPALNSIVEHCLEKNPDDRLQSAQDIAYTLESISHSGSTPLAEKPARRRWRGLLPAMVATAVVIGFAAFLLGRHMSPPQAQPRFHRMTFRRGSIPFARFAPDGHTIVYTAKWEGNDAESFSTKPEAIGSTSLGLQKADTVSVSPGGELLLVLDRHILNYWVSAGTLARVPITGGTPRPILENVQDADWAPDGNSYAVARFAENECRLEYPVGKVLYRTQGWISSPRISLDGKSVAFVDHPLFGDDQGRVALIDSAGQKHELSRNWASADGLAWSPKGNEVWFTASDTGINSALYGVTPAGKQRLILRPPGRVVLHDISRDGQLLMTVNAARRSVSALGADGKERDFTYLDWTRNVALSNDGSLLLFEEQGEGGGPHYSIYVRKMDGSLPTRLGEGFAVNFSPDNKWVLTSSTSGPTQLFAVPLGVGEQRQLMSGGQLTFGNVAFWLPSGKIVFNATETGRTIRTFVMDANGGTPTPITPEGISVIGVSPDSKSMLLTDMQGKLAVSPVQGGVRRDVPMGSEKLDHFAGWATDVNTVYMYRASDVPVRLYAVNLLTGAEKEVRQFMPEDPAGLINVGPVQITPDGKHYAYGYVRMLTDLYSVDALK